MEDYNEALRNLYENDGPFSQFAEWACKRKKGESQTLVGRLAKNANMDAEDAEYVLEQFSDWGLGRFKKGLSIEHSRFTWSSGVSLIDVVNAMKGVSEIDFDKLDHTDDEIKVPIIDADDVDYESDQEDISERGVSLGEAKTLIATYYEVPEDFITIMIKV